METRLRHALLFMTAAACTTRLTAQLDAPASASWPLAVHAAMPSDEGPGMPAAAPASTFSLHPNPASDHVEVTTGSDGPKAYRLMTPEGKVMQHGRLQGQRADIPLEFIEPGTYVLEVRDGKRVQQQRLIKH